jgi:hypothetical protein
MITINKILILCVFSIFLFSSCEKDENIINSSIPVIETANITPTTFTFGDSVTITAKISDAVKQLSTLDIQAVINGRIITLQKILLDGNSTEVNRKIFVPLIDNISDNTEITFHIKATNNKNGSSTKELSGFTGKRPYFTQLYLVLGNDDVYTLTPQTSNKDNYEISDVIINKSFTYRIAQKITADNKIDYSGLVWGNVEGKIQLTDETDADIFAFTSGVDYTSYVVFDNYGFKTSLSGGDYAMPNIMLDDFEEATIDGEEFYQLSILLTEGEEYNVYNELASNVIVYNMDFFDRINRNKIKFLGNTGNYTLYYNKTREHVVLLPENPPAYPDYILVTGMGIGYPSKIAKEHTGWGFGNVRNFLLTRKIAADAYQITMFIRAKEFNEDGTPNDWISFKPYENTGWGGEKTYSDFTYTGLQIFEGTAGSNIFPSVDMEEGIYRLIINWNTNTINVTNIELP